MSSAIACKECNGAGYVYLGVATVPCVCQQAPSELSQAERLAAHRRKTHAPKRASSAIRASIYGSLDKVMRRP